MARAGVVVVALATFLGPAGVAPAAAGPAGLGASEAAGWGPGRVLVDPRQRVEAPAKVAGALAGVAGVASDRVSAAGSAPTGLSLSAIAPPAGLVEITITAEPGEGAVVAARVGALGGAVRARAGDRIDAALSGASIGALAADRAVGFIEPTPRPLLAAVTGEQLAASGVDVWHAAGRVGAGQTVMVVDGGFAGAAVRQAEGELPAMLTTMNLCSGGFDQTDHGTAVAEIVHDQAPGAVQRLVCVDSPTDLETVVDDAIARKIRVITMSLGFLNSARGDGSGAAGTPNHAVARAEAAGIVWVNAAGNYAELHHSAIFDPQSNGYHDFSPSNDGNGVLLAPGLSTIFLSWDAWPTTAIDLDLHLYNASLQLVGFSETVQNGSQPPTERLTVNNPGATFALAYIAVFRASGVATPRFDLVVPDGGALEFPTTAGSLVEPASSPSAVAVGAYCAGAVDDFSSRGPTIDGRTKPDIAALDWTATATYGTATVACEVGGFGGTSAAAPAVAGAVAVILANDPSLSVAGVRALLSERALDPSWSPLGIDNDIGAGTLHLGAVLSPTAPSPPPPSAPPAPPPPAAGVVPPAPVSGPTGAAPSPIATGYWMLGSDGSVHAFGAARSFGSSVVAAAGGPTSVDLEPTPTGQGYWVLDSAGRISAFGDARAALGDLSPSSLRPSERPTAVSSTPTGLGYWVFTTAGRVVAFGDAVHRGDASAIVLNGPVLDSVATPSGNGYYLVAADGGIFAYGDASFRGSMGGTRLNAPVQSLVPDGDGSGYWMVASDGGVFAFDALFRGSMGAITLNRPVTGMVRFGNGYLMVGEDGGIFNFSEQPFHGSLGDRPPAALIVSVAALG